jgi:hypothetical protein
MEEEAAWAACSALGQFAGSLRSVEIMVIVANSVLGGARGLLPQSNSALHAYNGATGAQGETCTRSGRGGQSTVMEIGRVPDTAAYTRGADDVDHGATVLAGACGSGGCLDVLGQDGASGTALGVQAQQLQDDQAVLGCTTALRRRSRLATWFSMLGWMSRLGPLI